jgi:hypothetical protein
MDLNNLTAAELSDLKAKLDGLTDTSGRSPIRPRQLHNLTLLPTATDPRPLFVPSAEQQRDYNPGPPKFYPKLMWHRDTEQEITVHSKEEEQEHLLEYKLEAPAAPIMLSDADSIRAALESLTDEERTFIIQAQKNERIDKLKAKLAELSEVDLERLLGEIGKPKRQKKSA